MKAICGGMTEISWLPLLHSQYLPYSGTIDLEDACQGSAHRRPWTTIAPSLLGISVPDPLGSQFDRMHAGDSWLLFLCVSSKVF